MNNRSVQHETMWILLVIGASTVFPSSTNKLYMRHFTVVVLTLWTWRKQWDSCKHHHNLWYKQCVRHAGTVVFVMLIGQF